MKVIISDGLSHLLTFTLDFHTTLKLPVNLALRFGEVSI